MSENAKKIGLVVVIVLALAVAGFTAMRTMGSPPLEKGVDNSMPAGSKTGKQMEMENQGGAPASGAANERAHAADGG